MARLVLNCEGVSRVTHELARDIVMIGRALLNHIVIDHTTVSAQHAVLLRIGDSYSLKDLNSTNGTQINGDFVTDAELKDGDTIRFGSVTGFSQEVIANRGQAAGLDGRVFRAKATADCVRDCGRIAIAAPPTKIKRRGDLARLHSLTRGVNRKILSHHHPSDPVALSFWLFWDISHAPKHGLNRRSHLPGGVDLGLKSRSQKLGGGVGRLRRVRRVFFCCVVGVRVLTTDIVGEAAGTVVVVSDAAGVGEIVGNAEGVGEVVGNAAGVGGITAAICVPSVAAADKWWGVGLFAIPNTIATTAEKIPTIPTPIAQRARRCVCWCWASLCLKSISLRISLSRSNAVMISFGESVESD
jgi:pSer/pThr/pTyr-binding forkhead associated (FHA) protein